MTDTDTEAYAEIQLTYANLRSHDFKTMPPTPIPSPEALAAAQCPASPIGVHWWDVEGLHHTCRYCLTEKDVAIARDGHYLHGQVGRKRDEDIEALEEQLTALAVGKSVTIEHPELLCTLGPFQGTEKCTLAARVSRLRERLKHQMDWTVIHSKPFVARVTRTA